MYRIVIVAALVGAGALAASLPGTAQDLSFKNADEISQKNATASFAVGPESVESNVGALAAQAAPRSSGQAPGSAPVAAGSTSGTFSLLTGDAPSQAPAASFANETSLRPAGQSAPVSFSVDQSLSSEMRVTAPAGVKLGR